MNRTAKSFVVLLALLALAGAQVFGLQKGYLCECSGEIIETTYEYCHHTGGNMHTPCAEDHHEHDGSVPQDHEHEGDSHEHTPLTVELTAASLSKDVKMSAPAALGLSLLLEVELPDFLSFLIDAPSLDVAPSHRTPPPDTGGSAPAAVQVARCTVLLV